jgi:hypothetical protein
LPPSPDRLDGKRRRVVIGPHAHPSLILGQIVDSVRVGPPQFLSR